MLSNSHKIIPFVFCSFINIDYHMSIQTSTMSTSNNFHRSSFARSLSLIHLRNIVSEDKKGSSRKQGRRNSSICQNDSTSSSSRRAISPTSTRAMIEELPVLPFDGHGKETACKSNKKLQRRSRRVSFEMDIESHDGAEFAKQKSRGFRRDYALGDTARSPAHMILDNRSVNSLQMHDFAFIKRSDGSYSYAILADRDVRAKKNCNNGDTEECMIFVMDLTGATKMIRQGNWDEFVHLVCPEGIVGKTA